jgi:hypothetical protein
MPHLTNIWKLSELSHKESPREFIVQMTPNLEIKLKWIGMGKVSMSLPLGANIQKESFDYIITPKDIPAPKVDESGVLESIIAMLEAGEDVTIKTGSNAHADLKAILEKIK